MSNCCFGAWNGGESISRVWIITFIISNEIVILTCCKIKVIMIISWSFLRIYMGNLRPNWWALIIFLLLLPLTSLQYWCHVFIFWGKTWLWPIFPHNLASSAYRHLHTQNRHLMMCLCHTALVPQTKPAHPVHPHTERIVCWHTNTFHSPDFITAQGFIPHSDVALIIMWVILLWWYVPLFDSLLPANVV